MRNVLRILMPVALALLALAPPPAAAQTDGFMLHCLSARAGGLGCVTRGQEGVPTNLFHDPAGIVSFERPALEGNLTAFVPTISFQNSSNPAADGAQHGYPMGSLAYVGPKLMPKLAWAVGMEPIGGFGSDFRLSNPVIGAGTSYESFFAGMKVGPVLAYELAPGLSVGGSVSAVYAQIRDFRMPFAMPSTQAKGMAALAQLDPAHYPGMFQQMTELTAYGDSKSFAGTNVAADFGVSWKASPRLRLAASWSPKAKLALSGGSAVIDMGKQFNLMYGALVQERMLNHGQTQDQANATVAQLLTAAGLNLASGTKATYSAAADMAMPQTVGVGGSYKPAPGWKLAFEGGWMAWSKAMNDMPFRLTKGDNANINLLVNANPQDATFTYLFPLRWKDSYIGKVGVERAFGGNALRAGYVYGSSPVPDSAIFVAFPAIVEQSATLGATIQIGRFPLDVAVVHAFNKRVTGSSVKSLMGSEYKGSETSLQENVFTFGTVVKF